MSELRKVHRKPWIVVVTGIAAALWSLNFVMDLVLFGELSSLDGLLAIVWIVVTVMYSRPYAVMRSDGMTIAIAPVRPRDVRWDEIASFSEPKPGIVELGLADGSQLKVRVKDVKQQDQEYLRAVLQSQGSHTASSQSTAGIAASSQAAAGWFVDPSSRNELRYWDGVRWTDVVSNRGNQSSDPL